MKTTAVRFYGKQDLRLEEFHLPELQEDEILGHIISDSLCMSSYKAAEQGKNHKRVPDDVGENPIIIGHEFCGEIVAVGKKWSKDFFPGQKFAIQPALNYKGSMRTPGYSYPYIGGDATYIIIPNEVMEQKCLLHYAGDAYFLGSLAEPMSCIVGAFHANYHTTGGSYSHQMGIAEGGNLAILGGVGPMGMGAIDYAIHCSRKPKRIVVADIDEARLRRAATLYTVAEANRNGVELVYVNTREIDKIEERLLSLTCGKGFDDVYVFAPVRHLVETADRILERDGCLNFFAGPVNPDFAAELNFYSVHYNATHVVGTSGGNTADMIESLKMMEQGLINPAAMVTHVGGLNCVAETTLCLPQIPGGKKLIYTNIELELTAISDFAEKGESDPLFAMLAGITDKNQGLWSLEAENYLLANAKPI